MKTPQGELKRFVTGDFQPVSRQLVGETTAVSANAIVRLKVQWPVVYATLRQCKLEERRCAYCWADGIPARCRPGRMPRAQCAIGIIRR